MLASDREVVITIAHICTVRKRRKVARKIVVDRAVEKLIALKE